MVGGPSYLREVTYPFYRDIIRQSPLLTEPAAFSRGMMREVMLSGGNQAIRIRCESVTDNFFDVVGLSATMGRLLEPADFAVPTSAVISYSTWISRFGSDPQIIGRKVNLGAYALTIVGVGPRTFSGFDRDRTADLWVPITTEAAKWIDARDIGWLRVVARLSMTDGERATASTAFTVAHKRWVEETHAIGSDTAAQLQQKVLVSDMSTGLSAVRAAMHDALNALLFIVVVVWLGMTVSITNIQIERSTKKDRDRRICVALGATRATLARQECWDLVLTVGAAVGAGLGIAVTLMPMVSRLLPPDLV